jgi:hypothetical protein
LEAVVAGKVLLVAQTELLAAQEVEEVVRILPTVQGVAEHQGKEILVALVPEMQTMGVVVVAELVLLESLVELMVGLAVLERHLLYQAHL